MLLASKISAAILLAVLRLAAGLLPLKLNNKLNRFGSDQETRRVRINKYLSTFLCFGAGLLLSTCFIHMIPEVRFSFVSAGKAGNWHVLEEHPIAEAVICIGFFAVYLLEELGELLTNHLQRKSNVSKPDEPVNEDGEKQRLNNNPLGSHGHSHGPITSFDEENPVGTAIRGCLLTAALSFHSVFEGMAIGLQPSVSDVWFLFTAVIVHELAIMFCIGMEMLASKLKTSLYVAYMVELGLITSVGVAIGIVVTENTENPSATQLLVIAVLQGIAAGTLLYVTFLEVLERERRKSGNGLVKLGAIFLGFTLLSALEALSGKPLDLGSMTTMAMNDSTGMYEMTYSPFDGLDGV